MPDIIACLFLHPLRRSLGWRFFAPRGWGGKGILCGDDVTPSHTWKCIPPHCTVAMRVPNLMFLSSDAWAHRSRTDLPICVSENIVAVQIETRNLNGPIYCFSAKKKKVEKKVFSLPNFTVGKSGFISTHLSSNTLTSQHCASNYWSVVCKNDKRCRCFFFKWKLKAALLVFCLRSHSSSESWA